MITACIDPAVAEYVPDPTDASGDPYAEGLRLRAALCAAALEIRTVNPGEADRLLHAERAIADAMRSYCPVSQT